MPEEIPLPALLSSIKKNHIHYLEKNIKNEDVQAGQLPIILVLENNENISQKNIAETLNYSEGLITRFIKKLEENKYIIRETNTTNKRENIIRLTEKGKKLAQELDYYINKWNNEVLNFLTEKEKIYLQNTINRINANSEELI